MNDAITGMLNGFVPQNGTYKKGEHNVKLRNNKTGETAVLTTGSNIMGEKGEVKIFNKAGEQSRMLSLKPAGDQYIATLRNNETCLYHLRRGWNFLRKEGTECAPQSGTFGRRCKIGTTKRHVCHQGRCRWTSPPAGRNCRLYYPS